MAYPPIPPAVGSDRVSPRTMPERQISPLAGHRQRQGRNGEPPLAVPEPRAAVVARLRHEIRAIERHSAPRSVEPAVAPLSSGAVGAASPFTSLSVPSWTLGAPPVDAWLGPSGLDRGGVHELKPGGSAQGDRGAGDFVADIVAALSFALRLAIRRRAWCEAAVCMAPILWCATERTAHELGRLYAPGLAALGLDPSLVVVVETRRARDTLWAIEEGLRSRALALVIGHVERLTLTAARRLSLAAEAHQTPALLLTHPHAPPCAATATRWRIGRSSSAPHPFDTRAPGNPRYTVLLERSRAGGGGLPSRPLTLEWCGDMQRFRAAAETGPTLATHPHRPEPAAA